jgi:hypothetical protein
MMLLRYLIIDEDGRRVGRFDTSEIAWKCGDIFQLEDRSWRIVEILPEVSTMVVYNAVWVATPAMGSEDDDVTTPYAEGSSYSNAAR